MTREEHAKLIEAVKEFETMVGGLWTVRGIEAAYEYGRRAGLEEACAIVFGQCDSDNVAQRTVDAIRQRSSK